MTVKVAVYSPGDCRSAADGPVGCKVQAGRESSCGHGPRVRGEAAARSEGACIGNSDGALAQGGRGDGGRRRQSFDRCTGIGPDADRFAVRWADAGHSEERSDSRWHPLIGPVHAAVGGHQEVRAPYRGAAAGRDAAHRCQGGSTSGTPRSVHCVPPLVVAITVDPVARHVVSLEQEMPSRLDTPAGSASGNQTPPPFVVARIAAPGPVDEEPTALQLVGSGHEIAAKLVMVAGICSADHGRPRVGGGDDAGCTKSRIEVADCLAARAVDAGDGGEFTDSCRYVGLGRPGRPSVGRTDDDGAAENAEPDRDAVGRCGARDSVQAAHVRRNRLGCSRHSPRCGTSAQSSLRRRSIQRCWDMPQTSVDWCHRGNCCVQLNPPLTVLMIVEPAAALPVFPTATQSSAVEHEMPVRSTALSEPVGTSKSCRCWTCRSRTEWRSRLVPTAMHVVSRGQVIAVQLGSTWDGSWCIPVCEIVVL